MRTMFHFQVESVDEDYRDVEDHYCIAEDLEKASIEVLERMPFRQFGDGAWLEDGVMYDKDGCCQHRILKSQVIEPRDIATLRKYFPAVDNELKAEASRLASVEHSAELSP